MYTNVYATHFDFKNLQNCPKIWISSFAMYHGELNNLSGSPRIIGRTFNVESNKLFSMDFLPMNIGVDSAWKDSSICY